jgi:hypothetical protein
VEGMRNAQKDFVENPQGKLSLGKPRHTLEANNTTMGFRIIGIIPYMA